MELVDNPVLRWKEVFGHELLTNSIIQNPNCPHLQWQFRAKVQDQLAKYQSAGDQFWGNYPSVDELANLAREDDLTFCHLETGLPFPSRKDDSDRNVHFVGAIGVGKSTSLIGLAGQLVRDLDTTVIVFDHKGAPIDCGYLQQCAPDNLIELHFSELEIALLQKPTCVPPSSFIATFTAMTARHLELEHSKRLMLDSLDRVFPRCEEDTPPTFEDWMDAIKRIPVKGSFKIRQYQESALTALQEIHLSFGPVFSFRRSNMLELILTFPGIVVIHTNGLPASMAGYLCGVFAHYEFHRRTSLA